MLTEFRALPAKILLSIAHLMNRLTRFASLTAAVLGLTAASAHADSYDLASDWSNTSNPDGTWSYLLNGSIASSGIRDSDGFGPPGAPVIWGVANSYQGWSQDNGSQDSYLDIHPGDIYGHTPGAGGSIQIDWTSPITGTIDFTGDTWALRDIGRLNDWSVTLGTTLLDSGTTSSGDGHGSSNPWQFAASGLAVTAGEVLQFEASAPGTGDYIGVDLNVTTYASVPDAGSSITLLGGALAGLAALRRRFAK